MLSIRGLRTIQSALGHSRTYDEEASRVGACSDGCAEGPIKDALAGCLLEDFRAALKRSGVLIDNCRGIYGPEFELDLPGLPADLDDRVQRYCQVDGAVRMPFHYVVQAFVDDSALVDTGPDGVTKVYFDEFDKSQYVLVLGQPYVLDMSRKLGEKGAGSYWAGVWSGSVRGVAQILSTSGRFEESAKVYEIGGLYEEAGAERARAVPLTTVTLDLASLYREFQRSGMVSAFRCPSCGAGIRIAQDTPESKLRVCPYCGMALKEQDVTDFLSTILGKTTRG